MASQAQIDETYNYMDHLFRFTYGEHADCSAAMYDLDFTKTLAEAQKAKHEYIFTNLRIAKGCRVLDIGCGWGPVLKALKERGIEGVGLTLSSKQAEACARNGLEVHLADWKNITVGTFGRFDAVVSVGSFEHFCSKEEFLHGKQESIYRQFFWLCNELLARGERLYVQTMFWGENAPLPEHISVGAKRGSNAYIVAVLEKLWPGSWLPSSEHQIIECAKPYFSLVSLKNGRLDYIETMGEWNGVWKLSASKVLPAVKTLAYVFRDKTFHYKLQALAFSYNRECFRRKIMDHQRMVFEKG
jgi:cyclopropane-fatty-acyl-phospholipid synthase